MFELLAEPNRRAILSLLALSQQSVGEIERELRMPQSSVSKHLQVLRDAGFVESTVDYTPGPADRAHIKKDGENLTLILVKDLRHSPERSGKQILTGHICMNGHPVRPTKVGCGTTLIAATSPRALLDGTSARMFWITFLVDCRPGRDEVRRLATPKHRVRTPVQRIGRNGNGINSAKRCRAHNDQQQISGHALLDCHGDLLSADELQPLMLNCVVLKLRKRSPTLAFLLISGWSYHGPSSWVCCFCLRRCPGSSRNGLMLVSPSRWYLRLLLTLPWVTA